MKIAPLPAGFQTCEPLATALGSEADAKPVHEDKLQVVPYGANQALLQLSSTPSEELESEKAPEQSRHSPAAANEGREEA